MLDVDYGSYDEEDDTQYGYGSWYGSITEMQQIQN